MERLGYLVDLAHNSHQLIREIIAEAAAGTVLMTSHTGVQSVCDSFERNLNDDEIKGEWHLFLFVCFSDAARSHCAVGRSGGHSLLLPGHVRPRHSLLHSGLD